MGYLKENQQDSFYSIPFQQRMLLCGREASIRFDDIAKRHLGTQKKKATGVAKFSSELKKEFSRMFLESETANSELNERSADRMITNAYRQLSRKFEPLIHYIPCSIFFSSNIEKFEIGPVVFLHKREFMRLHSDELTTLRTELVEHILSQAKEQDLPKKQSPTKEQALMIGNRLVDGVVSSFESCKWIASVEIEACEEGESGRRALETTGAALNVIKLLLGSDHTFRLKTVYDETHASKSAKLFRNKDGKLNCSLSSTPQDNVVGDDWLSVLKESMSHYLNICSITLDALVKLETPPPLCDRFLGALAWYGDAVSERSASSKIVKYVSAIERMTGTGIEKGEDGKARSVTDIVVSRTSVLYSIATGESLVESVEKAKYIYDRRSRLVHGSLPPSYDGRASDAEKAEQIARMTLLSGLDFFSSLGLDRSPFSTKKLKAHFRKLEECHTQKATV